MPDRPTQNLLDYMASFKFEAPKGWNGIREEE
jgi:hypothetical protein